MEPQLTTRDDNPGASFPIVGIGASAGGLNALNCFIGTLPRDFRFAVVFFQHLSPKHKSLLPELLHNRRPDMHICEVADGMKLRPGNIFLCPAGKEIGIMEGSFRVTPLSRDHVHLPIDEFLASLAEDAGGRAIAVIFSGAGTDGARGIQAIRTAGGTVFVQDPATAEFPGMPLAAIGTGQADTVLPPEEIAAEIEKLIGTAPAGTDKNITPAQFEAFSRLIYEKTGHSFNHYKKNVVSRRIKRRMYLRGVASVQDYIKTVAENDSEAASLAADLMIGVTSFFRDRLAWKALRIEVMRKFAASNEDQPFRVWTPACATGEEAYSIAMMLRHEFGLAGRKREIQVFATDINDAALEKAREGKYPGSVAADIPSEYMTKFFNGSDDGLSVIISKEIRESVVFAKQDLLTDPPFSRLDLVICRNLLIYLEPDAQEKCIAIFHYALKDGGYLFLGNAESPGRKSLLFKSLAHKKCRIYRKIETKEPARLPLAVPFAAERAAAPSPALAVYQQSVTEFVQQALLEESGPAAVAINQHYEIVYNNGPTNRYLRQPRGAPTQNLLELLPENLISRIRGALYRVAHEAQAVSVRAIIPGDDRKRQVTLRISKLREGLFLVQFREKGRVAGQAEAVSLEGPAIEETAVRQLESELAATKEALQNHIEQLKSLNEELQSSNEELQAANEELETSREELQSLNEELITVNAQLQSKIEEQEETNNDLNNFLTSTNIPTMFLDQQFRVKRFTPAMSKLIKLIPTDVGRPIIDMSRENLGPDLIADAESVLEHLVPIKKEIAVNGSRYIRATLPYRTSDNRIEGVVITYNDVTEIKRAEERTRRLASFPQLNPNPVLEVDSSGEITFYNPAAEKILESTGLDKGDGAVFLPSHMGEILERLQKKEEAVLYREVTVKGRIFGETVHVAPQFNVVRIYGYDITEIKKAQQIKARLAAIVESADDAILSKDLKGIITTWNIGAERIFGYTAEEAIGKNISFLAPPDRKDETPEIIEKIKRGERIERFETERMHKNGTVIPVSLTFSPIRDENGRITGVSKIAHDITERRRAEDALRESEEQFRTLADAMPQLCWMADSDGYLTWYNKRWYEYTGMTPEQMEGWGWQSVHDPEVLPEVLERWKASIESGVPFEMEFPLRGADGVFRTFLTRVMPLKDANGKVLRWFGTNTDVSELKQAEEALRRSELFTRRVLNNLFAFVAVLTPDGTLIDVNEAPLRAAGIELSDVLGKPFWDCFWWNYDPDVQAQLRAACEGAAHGEVSRYDVPVQTAEDTRTWIDFQVAPLRDEQGLITHLVPSAMVIAERKQAEEEILRHASVQEGISRILREALSAETEEDLGRTCLAFAEEITRSKFGFIAEIGADGLLHDIAISDPGWELCTMYDKTGHHRPPGDFKIRGLYGRVLVDGKGFFTNDPGSHPDSMGTPEGHPALKSFLGAPFILGGKTVGMIAVGNREGGYRSADLETLEALAPAVVESLHRKRAEMELFRLTKVLKALSDSSQAVIRAKDEKKYLDEVCSIIIKDCGYSMVWIGFAENDEAKSIRPAAYSGFEDGYLETTHLTWADTERGRGPTGTAIRTGKVATCRNMLTDPAFAPWREEASRRGYASSIVFPLRIDGTVFGSLTIYSKEPDPFSEGEVKFLTELADNLAYGINVLRIRGAQEKAEESLQRSLGRFELLATTAGELLRSTEPQKVVESVCRKVMEYLDCHAFFNFLVDEDAGKLRLNACAGIPEEEAGKIAWLDFGVAVCGCAAREGQRIIAEHIPTTPDERTELVKSYGIKAYCCHPLLGPGGKVIGTLSFGTRDRETFSEDDISLMKAVTDQVAVAMMRMRSEADVLKLGEYMAAQNVELELVNKELESFIYSISHDLRAPLRSMGGFARIMVEDYSERLDDQGRDYLKRIRSGSEKMTRLIDDLLDLSKISRQEIRRTKIDISALARSVVSELREADPGRSVDVAIADGLSVFADARLMEIVLSNLLGNAWKFTSNSENARIEFGTVDEEKISSISHIRPASSVSPVFFVKDNGAGFDPKYVEKMFWPFQRLHTEKEFPGTGIGLTIVERIIHRHGGTVWAEGEVGKGATVYFTLG